MDKKHIMNYISNEVRELKSNLEIVKESSVKDKVHELDITRSRINGFLDALMFANIITLTEYKRYRKINRRISSKYFDMI